MDRITQKNLENLVDRINIATDSPREYCSNKPPDKFKSNIGNYCLDYAYNGVCLHRVTNEGGGVRLISTGGYGTKRELYNWMQAFLSGLSVKS